MMIFLGLIIFILSLLSVSAKLTIVSYCDVTLEACKTQDTGLALLEEKYPHDLQISYLYYFDTEDVENSRVHIALECANKQGMKEEYKTQIQNNGDVLTRDALKEYAAIVTLDTGNFSFCLDTMATAPEVLGEVKQAQADGVTMAPTVRFNNDLYGGSQTFTSLHTLVKEYLNINEGDEETVQKSEEEIGQETSPEEQEEVVQEEEQPKATETAEDEPVFFKVIKQIRAWLLSIFSK